MDIKNFYGEEVKFLMLKFIPKKWKWKWKRNPYNLPLINNTDTTTTTTTTLPSSNI